MMRYILLNDISQLIVSVSASLSTAMVLENSSLFLDIGVKPLTPSSNNMIYDGDSTCPSALTRIDNRTRSLAKAHHVLCRNDG